MPSSPIAKPTGLISIRDLYIRCDRYFQLLKEQPSRRFVITHAKGRSSPEMVAVLLSLEEYERLRRYKEDAEAYGDADESPPRNGP
jgi:hypothetical protein